MIGPELQISSDLKLIAPDVGQHSALSQQWRSGSVGHKTQIMMGIPPDAIEEPTVEGERALLRSFIDDVTKVAWMVSWNDQSIGAVEVNFRDTEYEKSPTVSIMIGDANARGKGVGIRVMRKIIQYLCSEQSYEMVYARSLTSNQISKKMLARLGFVRDGDLYVDEDGLEWQNMCYDGRIEIVRLDKATSEPGVLDQIAQQTGMFDGYKSQIETMISHDELVLFAAKIGQQFVGRVSLWMRDPDEPEAREALPNTPFVNALDVQEAFRRRGVGIRLLQGLEIEAINRGYEQIGLGVEPWNIAAIELYRASGYLPKNIVYTSSWQEGDEGSQVRVSGEVELMLKIIS